MKKSSDSALIIAVLLGLLIIWAGYGRIAGLWSGPSNATISAPCLFGERTYTVHIMAEHGTSVYGRAPRRLGHGSNPDWFMGLTGGDRMRLDTAKGYHDVPLLYGQPVFVNEKWYEVRLARDRRTITAAPLELDTAFVAAPQENWSAVLVGEMHLVAVGGTSEPIPVPVDCYFLYDYRQYGRADERGPVLRIASYRVNLSDAPRIEATAGETVRLNVGTPLTATATAMSHPRSPSTVYLSMELRDAGGHRVDRLTLAGGRRPTAPNISIVSTDGAEIHAATLEYG